MKSSIGKSKNMGRRIDRAGVEPLEVRIAPAFTGGTLDLSSLDGFSGFKIPGLAAHSSLGFAVSSAGDLNGDGLDDFLVGARTAADSGMGSGAVYVVFGNALGLPADFDLTTLDGTNGFKILAVNGGDELGTSVAAAGDVNGDGLGDIIVGADNADTGATHGGAAYVIFGRHDFSATQGVLKVADLNGTNGFALLGSGSARAGFSVAGAGDVNGDGLADVLVGAVDATNGAAKPGAAYLVFGRGNFPATLNLDGLTDIDGFKMLGLADGDSLGISVGGAGDLNGDGRADFVVGALQASGGRGTAYVVYGQDFALAGVLDLSQLNGTNGFSVSGSAANDFAGSSVKGAGDVNGDGLDDLLIGAPAGNATPGAAYLIFGKHGGITPTGVFNAGTLNGLNGFQIVGAANGDYAGTSVSSAGDVNGDGLADLLIGAEAADGGTFKGASYVIYGKTDFSATAGSFSLGSLNGSNGFKISGENNGDFSGKSVSNLGDVNGDGFTDLIVGAYRQSTSTGAAYVVYGGPSGTLIDPTFSVDHKSATWTDVDGDLVTLKVSKGTLDASNFELLANSSTDHRARLLGLNVGVVAGTPNPEFSGADITLTAKRAGGGDGLVNLGFLNSSNVDLGAVKVGGDLGGLFAGDDNGANLGLKSLTVNSFGIYGGLTGDGENNQSFSVVAGGMGPLKVAGDMAGGVFQVAPVSANNGKAGIASVTIGGSLLGGPTADSAHIEVQDQIGPVKIGGDVRGGAGANSAEIEAGSMASVTIGGSLFGGAGEFSGSLHTDAGALSSVKIGGSLLGGSGVASGSIGIQGNLGLVQIGGDQIGDGPGSATIANGGNLAGVTIGGDARTGDGAGTAADAAGIFSFGTMGPIQIKGDVVGTVQDRYLVEANGLAGGTNFVAIASVKIGGNFAYGRIDTSNEVAPGNGHGQIGTITVGGDWIASDAVAGVTDAAGAFAGIGSGSDIFQPNGSVGVVASIKSVTIKGAAMGTLGDGDRYAIEAEQIGSVSIGGKKLALTVSKTFDPANDLNVIHVGPTPDFIVREVSRTAAQPSESDGATNPAPAGARSADPAATNLGSLAKGTGTKFSGLANSDGTGSWVSSAGDINGDGIDDLIVGARNAGSSRGVVYVVFGQAGGLPANFSLASLNGSNGFAVSGAATGDLAGFVASAAGDVNGDGFADIVLTAPFAAEGGTGRGAAYVVFGHAGSFAANLALSSLDGTNGFKLSGVADNDHTGAAVSAADVNGDGLSDLIIGAQSAGGGGSARGVVYVVFGHRGGFGPSLPLSSLNGANGFVLNGVADNDYAGFSVSSAGDVNGDGVTDLIIGAPAADNHGAAYVVFGQTSGFSASLALSSLDGTNGFKLSGITAGDQAGYSVSGAGDVNGDGFADVIVSARNSAEGGAHRGAAYVVFGHAGTSAPSSTLPAPDSSTGFKFSGAADNDYAGSLVSAAGDVNGDGFADLIVNAPFADEGGNNRGAAYVVFGHGGTLFPTLAPSVLDGTNGFKLSGAADNDYAGGSVSAAGDINGDGYTDLIVGAGSADEGGNNRGAAYVVYGGPSGNYIDPAISADHHTATWTDGDGDLVTLKVTKGSLDGSDFKLLTKDDPTSAHPRAQLLSLTLGSGFEGADVSITAKFAPGGDGKVNVGEIDAPADLGKVTIGGDLGRINAGDTDATPALKSLTVGSLGVLGGLTQDKGGSLQSSIIGAAGAVTIHGDVDHAALIFFNEGSPATAASVTVGGSVIGGKTVFSGMIAAADGLGPVKIGGDLVGGAGAFSGYVESKIIDGLTIGGSMLGGTGGLSGAALGGVAIFTGSLNFSGQLGNITIGGDQHGGAGELSGALLAGTGIGKVSIKRDHIGGGSESGFIFTANAGTNIAGVTIGGSARGGDADFSGGILAGGTLGAVSIKGSVTGTADQAYEIRGSGPLTGTKSVAIASLKVGGDFDHAILVAGYADDNVPVNGHAQIGAISVGRNWIASSVTAGVLPFAGATSDAGDFGNGDDVFIAGGPSGVVASIASITIKGRAMGSFENGDFYGIVAEQIGSVKIGGVALALTKGPGNDLAPISVGPTPDFVIREVGRN